MTLLDTFWPAVKFNKLNITFNINVGNAISYKLNSTYLDTFLAF